MNFKKYIIMIAVLLLSIPTLVIASHHYHGYGCKMGSWNMTELDTDNDSELTFDEFIGPQSKKWRAGFDMIDTNGDGVIDANEWGVFLDVHNVEKNE